MEVQPEEALAGEPWSVHVRGLEPGAVVKLTAEQKSESGVLWQSHAFFKADPDGNVDPSIQAPISGSYEGVDPAGLFWSMSPVSEAGFRGAFQKSIEPQEITISVEVDGKRILSKSVKKLYMLPGVQRLPVNESGVVGTLFLPVSEDKRPAIIVLSGSEGGVYEPFAAMYASRGYVTLALAYFGMDGLPSSLVDIPVETVGRAIEWLEEHPRVDKDSIGIWGASKGAEFALLAASYYPQIKAVVATSPSSVVWEGVGAESGEVHRSSWSFAGEPLPFVHLTLTEEMAESLLESQSSKKPWSTAPMYEYALQDAQSVEMAIIPVEKINGPVLLVSGGRDGVWPAGNMSRMIMDRLKAKGHAFEDIHLHYEEAGHQIISPYSPTTVNWLSLPIGIIEDLGGTPSANAAASMDAAPRIQEFFQRNLMRSTGSN